MAAVAYRACAGPARHLPRAHSIPTPDLQKLNPNRGLAAIAELAPAPPQPAGMKHINLSFAACGFLGIYHLGAASALCKHGQKLLKEVKAFAGASAGSLAASVLLTAPEKIEECNAFTYMFAEEIRRQSFGAVTPGYDFMARLRSGMESILPPNAHELAHHRLHVSITNTQTRENYLVCSFSSREDLIKVLLASSFVPVYAGLKPVEYNGQKWVDGGLTNSLPILPDGRTVTISPFSGRLDICPQDEGQLELYVSIANQHVTFSWMKRDIAVVCLNSCTVQ
ncbi:patatin-like phospholipase domain-containing protein 4 isoform X2 [Rhinolophus ferrumequinum]|uniref:patatin-like phospholipase domain-containing protein 4 isoform X2 n=1 Tax=Rhinolophus ferrumequinum TaxID=59479 RepID=UPI00140FD300|nr:patatin-like phospholipase domain-containing protein 4 isoform X2 [Rhinolophus ferrumequinum]